VASWFRREHQNIPYAYPFLFDRNDPRNGVEDADLSTEDEYETKDQAIWSHSRLLHTLTAGHPAAVDEALNPIIVHFCKEENIICERVKRFENSFATETRVATDPDSPKYKTFRTMILRGKIALLQQQVAYLSGQVVSLADQNIAAAYKAPYRVTKGSITLDELIAEFMNDPSRRNIKRNLELSYNFLFRILREVLGAEKLLSEITRDDCKAVRALLLRLPSNSTKRFPDWKLEKIAAEAGLKGLSKMSGVTVNSHLHKMSALLNFAVKEERMDRNPARGLAISGHEHSEEDRLPFNEDQLKAIFNAPIYSGCKNDKEGWSTVGTARPRGTKFWIPLIALFHGLRLNEICQLRTVDIEQEEGVPYFFIRPGEKEQRVKSDAGKRRVPLHPMMAEFGFHE
jgi:integrase